MGRVAIGKRQTGRPQPLSDVWLPRSESSIIGVFKNMRIC